MRQRSDVRFRSARPQQPGKSGDFALVQGKPDLPPVRQPLGGEQRRAGCRDLCAPKAVVWLAVRDISRPGMVEIKSSLPISDRAALWTLRPSRMMEKRSQIACNSSSLWLTKITESPPARNWRATSNRTPASRSSSDDVGSFMTISRAEKPMARAMAIICCVAVLNCPGGRRRSMFGLKRPRSACASLCIARQSSRPKRWVARPRQMFAVTDCLGTRLTPVKSCWCVHPALRAALPPRTAFRQTAPRPGPCGRIRQGS